MGRGIWRTRIEHRQASEKGKELQEKLLSLEEAALKEASLEGALKAGWKPTISGKSGS